MDDACAPRDSVREDAHPHTVHEISDSRLRVLAGAAHISSVEQAEAFNRVLGKFLSGALPNERSNVRPADSRRAVCIEVPIEAPKEA